MKKLTSISRVTILAFKKVIANIPFLLVMVAVACFTVSAWLINESFGLMILGLGLIWLGWVIAPEGK